MSTQKLIRSSLAFAFALTTAGAALAEQPARTGYRDSVVKDDCAPAFASGASYRDSVARLGISTSAVHVAKGSNGYRDAYSRVTPEAGSHQVALAAPLVCRN